MTTDPRAILRAKLEAFDAWCSPENALAVVDAVRAFLDTPAASEPQDDELWRVVSNAASEAGSSINDDVATAIAEAVHRATPAADLDKPLEAHIPITELHPPADCWQYAHMCRDGHAQIGHNDSEHERCPVCRERDRADAAEAKLANYWHPIETAPKDGTPLLIWCDGSHLIHLFWKVDHWEWLGGGRCAEGQYRMTHWMPLPDPPPESSHG